MLSHVNMKLLSERQEWKDTLCNPKSLRKVFAVGDLLYTLILTVKVKLE